MDNQTEADKVIEQRQDDRRRRATLEAAIRFAETTAKANTDPSIRAQAAARAEELRSLRDG